MDREHASEASAPGSASGPASRGGAARPVAISQRCPLCGVAFEADGRGCRPSCPLAKGCSVLCCPSCGYGFPQETGLARRLRALIDRLKERRGVSP